MAPHLRETKHPYHCSSTNYYSNDTHVEHPSWAHFLEAEGKADMDYNLLFRWDWHPKSEDYEAETLELFFMGQRKGLFRAATVRVALENEPEIRAWLVIRWGHMKQLWAGVSV